MNLFGDLFRHYRKRAGLTQERLAELLGQEPIGEGFTGATISHWENGIFHIRQDKRNLLVYLIKVLHQHGGIQTIEQANSWLTAGDYRPLNDTETRQVTPAWLSETRREVRERPFLVPTLPPQGVLGRDTTLGQIIEYLQAGESSATDVPPVVLRGMGGIGKTTLAIAIGRKVAHLFPDGVLWVALGPKPAVRSLLNQWGRAMGIDLLPEPDEAACRARLQSLFFHRRLLLVIDDVWEVAHGRFFALAGPNGRTLFTTREIPVAHGLTTRQHTLPVDVLDSEAAWLLLNRLVPEIATNEKAARALCDRLEYLPLALTLAGRLLANEADVPQRMHRLLQELMERREARLQLWQSEGRLGTNINETAPISLHAILGMSVSRLSGVDQERFAMLSVFGGEPLTWEINAAAHVWECSLEEAAETVIHFVQRGLVERRNGRYWMHTLLADYAADLREAHQL